MQTIYVLDTNVILTHNDVLSSYASQHVAIPDTVLAEIDKIKIGRADAETRYAGREFTRALFDLAAGKSLSQGIETKQGGSLRVLTFDTKLPLPEGYSSKNPDDRIILAALRLQDELRGQATQQRSISSEDASQTVQRENASPEDAIQVAPEETSVRSEEAAAPGGAAPSVASEADAPTSSAVASTSAAPANPEECPTVTLVTSDLNMLIKAQGAGLSVKHHDDEVNTTFSKRFIVKPFQKYRAPLIILIIAFALFVSTCYVAFKFNMAKQGISGATLTSEYRVFLNEEQANTIDALVKLQTQPYDATALTTLGNAYFDLYGKTVKKDPATAVSYAKRGVDYFKRALELHPTDSTSTRNKMGILALYAGDTDTAINQLTLSLEESPNDVEGNYYLAIVYMQGRRDLDNAEQLFNKVVELTKESPDLDAYRQSAQGFLKQIAAERERLSNPATDGVVL